VSSNECVLTAKERGEECQPYPRGAPPLASKQARPPAWPNRPRPRARRSGESWKFVSKGLKPGFHFIGSRVETGRYQAMGLNWIQLVQPHHGGADREPPAVGRHPDGVCPSTALYRAVCLLQTPIHGEPRRGSHRDAAVHPAPMRLTTTGGGGWQAGQPDVRRSALHRRQRDAQLLPRRAVAVQVEIESKL
jgi:hypothetical protein